MKRSQSQVYELNVSFTQMEYLSVMASVLIEVICDKLWKSNVKCRDEDIPHYETQLHIV